MIITVPYQPSSNLKHAEEAVQATHKMKCNKKEEEDENKMREIRT